MALKLIMFNLQYKKSVLDVHCTIFLIKIIVFESLIDINMWLPEVIHANTFSSKLCMSKNVVKI
jgi:hypothetical protein